jgi:hypothetical protein
MSERPILHKAIRPNAVALGLFLHLLVIGLHIFSYFINCVSKLRITNLYTFIYSLKLILIFCRFQHNFETVFFPSIYL